MKNDRAMELDKEEQIQLATRVMKRVSQPMIATSANRRLLYWNAAFSKLTGYNNKELSDPIISAGLTAPEWHESEIKALEKLQHTGKSQIFQKEYIRKDGMRIPVEVLVYQLSEGNGKVEYYVGLISDITQRKELEEALQKSESHYRTLVDSAIEGIVVIQDGGIKFVNPVVIIETGYSREELQSMPLQKLFAPGNEKTAVESISKVAIPGSLLVVPLLKIRTKTGDIRFIESTITSIVWDDKPANLNLLRDITDRKKAEEVLSQSELKYQSILEDIREGYWEVDLAGNFISFNDAVCRLVGYSKNEIAGANYRTYTSAADTDKVYKAFNQVYRTGKPIRNMHYEIVHKDGSKRAAETSVFPRRNGNGEIIGFRGVSHDITERKNMEETLRHSEERYRTILDEMQDAYLEVDLAGNFTFGNNALYRYLGYSPDELIGSNFRTVTAPDDVEMLYQKFNQIYRTGTPINDVAYKFIRKDGSIGYVEIAVSLLRNEKGEVIGFRGVGRDVTERKNTEETLRRSEERYRTILEDMEETYFELDLDGNFTFFNNALCLYFGYSREELLGMNYRAYVPPEDVKSVAQAYNQVFRTGKPITLFPKQDIKKDGTLLNSEISIAPLRNEKGEIIGFRGVGRDITKRVQTEKALIQSEEKYRSVLERMDEAYSEVDLAGNFTFFNEALCRHLGYSREELLGMNYKVYTTPDNVKKVFQAYNQVYLTGEPIKILAIKEIRKDEKQMVAEISVSPIRNESGEIIGFRELSRDITERLQMEADLRRSEEKYRSILDTTEESYYEVDLAGNFTFFNEPLRRGLGYTKEELIGMNYRVYTPPEIADKVFQAYNQVYRTGEPLTWFPMEQVSRDGTRAIIENSILPKRNETGEIIGFRGIGRDISKRVQMEEALKQSEKRYRTILEDIQESYFEMDLAGNYTFFNDAQCRQLGYSREEMMGMNYRVYVPPQNRKEAFEIYNRIYSTGEPAEMIDVVQIRKDGNRIFVESSAYPIKNEKNEIIGFRGVSRDVTQRVQMEEALRHSEERYRTVLEDMEEAYYELNIAGNYTFFNDALPRLLGYTSEELMGIHYKDYVPPEDVERVYRAFNKVYSTGEPLTVFPMERIRKDGTRIFTETSAFPLRNKKGEIIGFRGVIRDITERKQAEEEYRTIIRTAMDGFWLTDMQGHFLDVNEAYCKLIGYSRDELLGMSISDVEEAEKPEDVAKRIQKIIEFGHDAFETVHRRKDGKIIDVEVSVNYLPFHSGRLFVAIRDITEQKKAEEDKKQLEQKAQLASRLASVGELASGVAHEINNPLTGVIGYAHLLLARKDISRDVRRDLEIINEGAQRVAGIVKKLLAFARQTKPEQRYVNINELIRNTLDLRAYELAASNIKVTLQLIRDMPMTIADPGQLQQVFLNLIINAETEMKIARDGGRLTIKTDRINNTIRITFKDTGPGIARENLETIFDPFFTTREVGQGTGLGLSVCHGIVTEHNGKIWAESEPGKGATFIIELPLTTEDKQLELTEHVVEEPKKITKAKILVVDDEPVIRQLISKVLGDQGHTVETIDNAAGALKMVKSKRYGLILLDIKMPGMSGIELYKQFQKIAPSLTKRVVFITGDVMGKRTLAFIDKTKTPYLMKPFDAKELKSQINRILAKK
jgi:PAS domain S-box-containing protein